VYQPTSVGANSPVITPGRVQNAASYLGAMAPGSLAALWGTSLADNIYPSTFDHDSGAFANNVGGTSVTVDSVKAPLIYVSPTQINFQIPWETKPGPLINIQVSRNSAMSNAEPVTIDSTAPSVYFTDYD